MRYADLHTNDIVNGDGVCTSLWLQGCPLHCKNCHNPQTWDKNGGIEIDKEELKQKILQAINKNGIKRNLSILGGEPLAPFNIDFTIELTQWIREKEPNIKIFIWTGYNKEELIYDKELSPKAKQLIFDKLICGRYEDDKRDTTLHLRGSSNQEILYHI